MPGDHCAPVSAGDPAGDPYCAAPVSGEAAKIEAAARRLGRRREGARSR